ncbi:MAG: immunoglobulin domain-containing protein [Verrucomicrobiota bacterium JB023]|nr:immunoglobulin domain-containing protein [Verrucomicrobiota bacterium JB023]
MKNTSLLGLLTSVAISPTAFAATLLSEDFDSLAPSLEPFVSPTETNGDGTDWTSQLPADWTHSYGPSHQLGGPTEFDGWRGLDPVSWNATAEQGRDNFTLGSGVIMVADTDEYDDINGSAFEGTLTSPAIDLSTVDLAGTLFLQFDSSWNAEPQVGKVLVTYQGDGANFPVEYTVIDWDGDTKATALNETVFVALNNPEGATSAQLSFYHQGDNNWWWAIDNIEVFNSDVVITAQPKGQTVYEGSDVTFSGLATDGLSPSYQWYRGEGSSKTIITGANEPELQLDNVSAADAGYYSVEVSAGSTTVSSEEIELVVLPVEPATIYFNENFDSIELGYPVQEGAVTGAGPFVDQVWSSSPPAGWVVDRSGVNGIGDSEVGVEEWEGWNFADPDWWSSTAGNQSRSDFTRSSCALAVVDPDEWDDLGSASQSEASKASLPEEPPLLASVVNYDTTLTSPAIDISSASPDSLKLRFSSSWRPEDSQMVILWVSFDGGEKQKLLHWNSYEGDVLDGGDGIYKDDATNESVLIDIPNPSGASSMELIWEMPQADNDWWWAIDNILVFTGSEPADVLIAPNSQTVLAGGGDVTFTTQADGIGSFTYLWTGPGGAPVGSDNLDDPTNTITIYDPGLDDVGNYAVTISNSAGSIELCSRLSILPAIFTRQPEDKTGEDAIVEGLDAFIDVTVESYDPEMSYQWYSVDENETKTPISGASSEDEEISFSTPAQQNPETGVYETMITLSYIEADLTTVPGRYCLEVTNQYGTVTSRTAELVVVPINFTTQPNPAIAYEGDSVQLASQADAAYPITYQWYKGLDDDKVAIDGATSANLTLNPVAGTDNGYYSVEARSDDGEGGIGILFSNTVRLTVYVDPAPFELFSEDFNSLPLGSSIDEENAADAVWTQTPPAGWTADNTGVPGFGEDIDGVTEWAGWAFTDSLWWSTQVDTQGREEFSKGTGTVMVADPDEWDDNERPSGTYNTFITTPSIPLQGAEENSVVLSFDSSWRYEGAQKAQTEISFDGGESWEPLLIFSSATNSADFKDHATNDTISLPVFNPSEASSMMVRFSLVDAGNNWWWAVDNLSVTGDVAGGLLTVTDTVFTPGGITLTWTSDSSVSYQITWSDDLLEWNAVTGLESISGENGTTTRNVDLSTLPGGIPSKVYLRVERL